MRSGMVRTPVADTGQPLIVAAGDGMDFRGECPSRGCGCSGGFIPPSRKWRSRAALQGGTCRAKARRYARALKPASISTRAKGKTFFSQQYIDASIRSESYRVRLLSKRRTNRASGANSVG